jgi:hypothetical protein
MTGEITGFDRCLFGRMRRYRARYREQKACQRAYRPSPAFHSCLHRTGITVINPGSRSQLSWRFATAIADLGFAIQNGLAGVGNAEAAENGFRPSFILSSDL